jgi:hypothetical protein
MKTSRDVMSHVIVGIPSHVILSNLTKLIGLRAKRDAPGSSDVLTDWDLRAPLGFVSLL